MNKATDRTTVLLVSVGGAVSEGTLIGLAPYRDQLTIVGTTSDPSTSVAADCDVCIPVAPASEVSRFETETAAALRTHRPAVAFPCRDADFPALARIKAADPQAGRALLVGSVRLAEAMNDKLLMLAFMERCGLRVAPTASTAEEADRLLHVHGFPLIAKPRGGSGTKGVHIVFEETQLRHCLSRGGYVVQPYIGPPDGFRDSLPDIRLGIPFEQSSGFETFIAIRGLIGPTGMLEHVAKVDVINRFGRPFRLTRMPLDEADRDSAQGVAAALHAEGFIGPFALQGRVASDGTLTYFEMLTRIGGGTAGFTAMGLNQPRLLVEMFAGRPLSDPAGTTAAGAAEIVEWHGVPRPVFRNGPP